MSCCAPLINWGEEGLPCPIPSGYGFVVDSGLIRTPGGITEKSGNIRQARRVTTNLHVYNLQWLVDAEVLQTMTEVVHEYGYTPGVSMPLVSDACPTATPILHDVRFISDLAVTAADSNLYTVTAQVEQVSL